MLCPSLGYGSIAAQDQIPDLDLNCLFELRKLFYRTMI